MGRRKRRRAYFLLIEGDTGLLQASIFEDLFRDSGHSLYRAAAFLLEGTVEQDKKRGFSFLVERIDDLGGELSGREDNRGEQTTGPGVTLPTSGRPGRSRAEKRRAS